MVASSAPCSNRTGGLDIYSIHGRVFALKRIAIGSIVKISTDMAILIWL
jgi:hypothetical protein